MNEIADDFAFLCDDIIYDVLEFVYFEWLRENFFKISPFGSRWGDIAHRFRDSQLVGNEIVESRLDGRAESFTAPAKNRRNVAINSICLYAIREFNEIEHLAANAYEKLEVYCEVIPKEFLENLGNRFTKIVWRNQKETKGEIDFLKRQLKSPHLRILEFHSQVLARPDFTDLLVDFVRKKNFETLNVISSSRKGFSERVFLAAYEAWLQRRDCEHLRSWISAWISTEDLHQLTARIPNCSWNERSDLWGTEWSYNERHPTANYYEMRLFYYDCNPTSEVKHLTMSLFRGDTKYSR